MRSFHEIIGQHRPIQLLQSLLRTGEIPNALLLTGEEGIGKRSAARLFIQTLFCQNPLKEGDEEQRNPCHTCLSCRKMESGNHPDFFILEPEGAFIKIDRVRAIQEKMIYRPIDAAWKIVLIDPADTMTPEAQNSLLKTLEEPPPYLLLMLISAKPTLLVATLLSRCQKISFSSLALSQIEAILVDQKGLSVADARLTAAITGGRLAEALSVDVEEARKREETLHALVNDETLAHYETLFEMAQTGSRDAETMGQTLDYLSAYFRDLLVLLAVEDRSQLDPSLLVFPWRRKELERWADRMNPREVARCLADVTAIQQTLSRNINRQLALETLLMQMRDKLLPESSPTYE